MLIKKARRMDHRCIAAAAWTETFVLSHLRPLIDGGNRNIATRSNMILRLLKKSADADTLSAVAPEILAASMAGAMSSRRGTW
jgi:hypothetical protein